MTNTRSFASCLLLAASLAACASAEDRPSVTILERADAAPAPADAAVDPGPEPTGPVAAEYEQISSPTGVFQVDMDADANDAIMVWGDLATEAPTATLYLELYEGWGHFTDVAGDPVQFGQLSLPDEIEIGDNERDFGLCGACLSIFIGLPADWSTYDAHLLAQSGTIELTAVPTAPNQGFTAILHDVTFAEIDDWGVVVPGGQSAHVTTLVVSATPAAE